jgi:hypothetical protein
MDATEIQSLTTEIERLNRSVDWWNSAIIVMMVVAALAATGLLITQYVAFKRASLLAQREARLGSIKDNQLAIDLKDKDAKIAVAGQLAAEANEKAESERLARVQLEEAISWRRLTAESRAKLSSRLTRFSGQYAWLIYNLNDVEAFGFASDLAGALHLAKWEPTEPESIMKMVEGPIPLGTHAPLERGVIISNTGDKASSDAADALVSELVVLGFDARKSPSPAIKRNETRPTVFISVEPRPEGPQGDAKIRTQHK